MEACPGIRTNEYNRRLFFSATGILSGNGSYGVGDEGRRLLRQWCTSIELWHRRAVSVERSCELYPDGQARNSFFEELKIRSRGVDGEADRAIPRSAPT
ncbi:hypothetical protein T4E_6855 [Trichinella pseudospiralis]|uniref:Uncharacterized protein n=1 Tax=Trichinella pseudospiralis TaxID=6337 RepID=A0A0V0YLA1_TRIPS|nr:hypothetical protein T4E_6855 [Trichinella pseudospiralis]